MRYRRLGRTGLSVSEISLGTVEIGLDYGLAPDGTARRPDESQAARILNRALDLGVNFLDTARAYGESEALIGRLLRCRRSDFLLCSKVAAGREPEIRASVETSLQALGRASLDILMIHSAPLDEIETGETLGVLRSLQSEGKTRWIGASVYGNAAALAAIRTGLVDCLQVACSVLDRRAEPALWEEARINDIGIVGRSVLLRGALTDRYGYLPDSLAGLKQAVRRMEAIAHEAGISLPELAYRYVLGSTPPHTALVGAASAAEVEAAVDFAERGPLSEDLIRRVREVSVEDERDLNPSTWDQR